METSSKDSYFLSDEKVQNIVEKSVVKRLISSFFSPRRGVIEAALLPNSKSSAIVFFLIGALLGLGRGLYEKDFLGLSEEVGEEQSIIVLTWAFSLGILFLIAWIVLSALILTSIKAFRESTGSINISASISGYAMIPMLYVALLYVILMGIFEVKWTTSIEILVKSIGLIATIIFGYLLNEGIKEGYTVSKKTAKYVSIFITFVVGLFVITA
ncbi:MAG: Yip1 family protein [Candidatus Wukongarchaeota archaeon]|nr:Yip1 family protein [Candidatus Wukongarchaeota archaeon]